MSRHLLTTPAAAAAGVALIVLGAPGMRPPGGPYLPPVLPLRVAAGYDPPEQPWQPGHRGVDLAAAEGAAVRAAATGTVSFAGSWWTAGGRHRPRRVRTTYEPVAPTVVAGQVVAVGDPIGTIAAGAHCSQRCLHWGALLAGSTSTRWRCSRPTGPS